MKLGAMRHSWILTGVWILAVILTLRFPAAENLSLLFVILPGMWLRLVGNHSPTEVSLAIAGIPTVFLIALSMDCLGLRLRAWLKSVAWCAGLLILLIAFFYVKEAIGESSFAGAAHKFDFDRLGACAGYLLLCASGGLLVGSAWLIGFVGFPRLAGRLGHDQRVLSSSRTTSGLH